MIRATVVVASLILLAFITIPLAALIVSISPAALFVTLREPAALAALRLSAITTTASLTITLVLGTPLAYALARSAFPGKRYLDALVDLPIVVPPAVAGLGLLLAYGRLGIFGPALHRLGIDLGFSTAAVVLAQVFVASPFYVRAARGGFATVDTRLEDAAGTLGLGPLLTFARVTVPLAAPALFGGAILSWARALGEFGATIMFAGNLSGVSQTLPLAVYLGLESGDLRSATALSVVLVAVSFATIVLVRTFEAR